MATEEFFDFKDEIELQENGTNPKEVILQEKRPEAEIKQEKEAKEVKPSGPAKLHMGAREMRRFNLGYLTFDVADFYGEVKPLESTSEYTRYQFRFYSHSNGFIDRLFGWMSHTASVMRVYDDKVVPEKFRTKTALKKREREIAIDYNESGKIVFDQVTPPDNRHKRPAVTEKQKAGTYDPLSIALEARRLSMAAVAGKKFSGGAYKFSLPLYDGRRRSSVDFVLSEKKVNGQYQLRVIQKPVAGFTNNEWKDIQKGQRVVDVFIDPETFWPVGAAGDSPLGNATAKIVEVCSVGFDECIKKSMSKRNSKNRQQP